MFIYEIVEGQETVQFQPEGFLEAAEGRGYAYIQPCNRIGLRDELIGHPMFFTANGPMWGGVRDGVAVIRYEAPARRLEGVA